MERDGGTMRLPTLARRVIGKVWGPPETPSRKFDRMFRALKPGDIAIDCGANVGQFTEIMARNGATVYAFEPNPHAFAVLERRFAHATNVHCLEKAVHTEEKIIPLFLHENSGSDPIHWSTGSSLLAFKSNVNEENYTEVEAIDFCEFIDNLEHHVSLTKMDIEGAEVEVIGKLIKTGTIDRIKHLLVEVHDDKIPELTAGTNEIRALIQENGLRNIDLGWV